MHKLIAGNFGRLLVLVVFQYFFAAPTHADVDTGRTWLLSTAQSDGAFVSASRNATAFQNTGESLDTLALIGGDATLVVDRALSFLANDSYDGTSYLAQRLLVHTLHRGPVTDLTNSLKARLDVMSALGEFTEYHPTPLDTALALAALDEAGGLTTQEIAYTLGALLDWQQVDGGWAMSGNESDVIVTATVVRTLARFCSRFSLDTQLSRATGFLLGQRDTSGVWASTLATAQAVQALMPWMDDPGLLADAVTALKTSQSAAGDWDNDVMTTAVALRALWFAHARGEANTVLPSTAGVRGRVVDPTSGEPIVGALVEEMTQAGVHVQSGPDGGFLITSLVPGAHTLLITKSGYSGVSASVDLVAGQVADLGDVALSVRPDTAIFRTQAFDAFSADPIQGASVHLVGATSYDGVTDATGELTLTGVVPGSYRFELSHPNYQSISGDAELIAGVIAVLRHGMLPTEAVVEDAPITLTGRIVDGQSGEPLAGATLSLDTAAMIMTDANGVFSYPQVAAGAHALQVVAEGYSSTHFDLNLPVGSSGLLGNLAIFPATNAEPPSSLTFKGHVQHGVTGDSLAGVDVLLVETGEHVPTDSDGNFILTGITLDAFKLQLSGTGFVEQEATVSVQAFGEVSATFALQPVPSDPGADVSTLSGSVIDLSTDTPIGGVQVTIPETGVSVVSAEDGSYQITDIAELSFTVQVTALGYQSRSYDLNLDGHGLYNLPVKLAPVIVNQTPEDPATQPVVQVLNVSPEATTVSVDQALRIHASVGNLSTKDYAVQMIGEVQDSTGATVALLPAVLSGTETPAPDYLLQAGATEVVEFVWHTGRAAPSSYRVVARAIEPGTVTRALPSGVVYASAVNSVLMTSAAGIEGFLEITPPMAQAGLDQPVFFQATLINAGNVTLSDQLVELAVYDEADETVLYSKQVAVSALALEGHTLVDFGSWTPTTSGNLPVRVRAVGDVAGEIATVLYVGDRPSGQFTLASNVTPEGTHTIRAMIDLQGVDVTEGSVSDPLFGAVQKAVETGGIYVAREGVNWQNRNRCLGCHIQTQSVYGLASSFGKAPIDHDKANLLHNSITSALQSDGVLTPDYPQYRLLQTALGAWSLTSWPDKQHQFRTLYKAAGFLSDHGNVSGNKVYWVPEQASGWWYSREATTTLVVKALAEVVRQADNLAQEDTLDYRRVGFGTQGFSGMRDLEVGPDGAYYVVTANGHIWRMDAQTGSASLWFSGLVSNSLGLAFDDSERAYVSTANGRLYRIDTDKSLHLIATTSGELNDVEFGPDGLLYVSNRNARVIYRVNPAAPAFEAWVSGGLLNGPRGIGFQPDGGLIVANHGGYNLLRINPATKHVSVFADGLQYPPLYVDVDRDGAVYYTSQDRTVYSLYGPYAVNRVTPDGQVERLVYGGHVYGISVDNGQVFYLDDAAHQLYRLASFSMDRSKLGTFRSRLDSAARYLMGQSVGTELIRRAMILTGLGEIYSVSQDEALKAQMLEVMNENANYLRANQRPDGGWGRYVGWGSDAMVTALVGLALEYTDPSPQDPQVRAAILYLLGTQQADDSWRSNNGILGTHLAATSLVMAYLPEALERLGGIDVDLQVTLPADISLSNATRLTESTSAPDGSVAHQWRLLGVTSSGRNVDFDLTFHDMVLNEERPAALKAQVQFRNSFTDELLTLPLDIPSVRAVSGVQLQVKTDKPVYGADEDAMISAVVTNASAVETSGTLQLAIHAQGSDIPLAVLEPQAVSPLAAGKSRTYTVPWNVGRTLAGAMEVHGVLLDSLDRVAATDTAQFDIAAPSAVLSSTVRSDKPVYDAWDEVRIDGQVINQSLNAIQGASVAVLTVTDPAGNLVHNTELNIGELVPQRDYPLQTLLRLDDAPRGDYGVELRVRDRFNRALLTTATAGFQVVQQRSALSGSVISTPLEVPLGRTAQCNAVLNNRASVAQSAQAIRQQLINVTSGAIEQIYTNTLDFAAGESLPWSVAFDTHGMALGNYLCVLEAQYQGVWNTLDIAGFQVVLSVEGELTIDPHGGRLLVLMDEPPPSGGDGLESPEAPPTLEAQRLHLEQVLSAAGWSYTIVSSEEDFLAELRSGGYTSYALLSEHIKLGDTTAVALRESIRGGRGLFVAGTHDNRNNLLGEVLGVRFGGELPHATDVHVLDTPELAERWVGLVSDRKRTELMPLTARVIGQFDDGTTAAKLPVAVVINNFGAGHAVTVGADLIAESTLEPTGGFGDLLLDSLALIQPAVTEYRPGDVVPLLVSLRTLAPEVSGEVHLALPADVSLVAGGDAALAGDELVWPYHLLEDAPQTLKAWIRLPLDTSAPTDLSARVFIDFDGVLTEHTQFDLRIEPLSYPDIEDIQAQISILALGDRAYSKAHSAIDAAVTDLASGDLASALEHLGDTAEELANIHTQESASLGEQVSLLIQQLGRQWWEALPPLAAQLWTERVPALAA